MALKLGGEMRFKRAAAVALVALSMGGGWAIGQALRAGPALPPGGAGLRSGEEWLLVFVGASWCAASKDTGLKTIVPELITRVAREAQMRSAALVRIGIATDWVLEDGLAFLKPFGPFDEVIVGRSWLNSGYDRYVRDAKGAEGLPQIVLVSRKVVLGKGMISYADEKFLGSAVGPKGIRAWHADTLVSFLLGANPSGTLGDSTAYRSKTIPMAGGTK